MLSTSNALGFPVLSMAILMPLVGAAVVAATGRGARALHHGLGVLFAGLTAILAVVIFALFDSSRPGFQFTDALDKHGQPVAWLPGGITYQVGLDGIGLVLFSLAALLALVALVFSWGSIRRRSREFVVLMLMLEAGLLGVFAAMDLFLFYVFWELTLVPMVLVIGVWGGQGRVYAAMKFVLYTMAGSALMLVAIIALVHVTASPTFRLADILARPTPDLAAQWLLFGAFALAFAVKVPLFPFHTWLPDAHVEAPAGGSVLLAGVLLKMGTYGFVRFAMPLFPEVAQAVVPVAMALGIVGIWYGAWVAFAQKDIKSLVAYSSVSHMGVVMVGLFALNTVGLGGGVLQMVNHGLATGALFLLVGMLYDRGHTRRIADYSGLWSQMPRFSSVFLLMMLSSIGLPGLAGFVGEWLSLAGAFRAGPWYGALAAIGVVLGAAYMLWLFQRLFFGPPSSPAGGFLHDLTGREMAALAPLVVLIVWIGLFPHTFLAPISNSGSHWLALMLAPRF